MWFAPFFLHLKYVRKCSRDLRNMDVHNRLRHPFRNSFAPVKSPSQVAMMELERVTGRLRNRLVPSLLRDSS